MSPLDYQNAKQSADIIQRRPLDGFWFAVLFVSIAIGIGMTIFAPVGDEPRAVVSSPVTIAPTTVPTTLTTTQPATQPTP